MSGCERSEDMPYYWSSGSPSRTTAADMPANQKTPAPTPGKPTPTTLITPQSTPPMPSDSSPFLLISRKSPFAKIPTRGSPGSAGYDLYAPRGATIKARGQAMISTDIVVQIPSGHYGRIAARSGLALRHGIAVNGGVIDSDYRDVVGVILVNHSDEDYQVRPGDRIAQLIMERISTPEVVEVGADSLTQTDRGTGGFGSTGK